MWTRSKSVPNWQAGTPGSGLLRVPHHENWANPTVFPPGSRTYSSVLP
jgi:hypothetical protein